MSASDLTSTFQVQAWVGSTNYTQSAISVLIPPVSAQILAILGRQSVLPYAYTEVCDGWGGNSMMLRQFPVQSVSSVIIDGLSIAAAPTNAAGGGGTPGWLIEPPDPFPPGRQQSLALRGKKFCRGTQNVTVSYVAGYQVSGEIWTVPSGSSPQIRAGQSLGRWGSDAGVTYQSTGAALSKVAGSPSQGQYSISPLGNYTFSSADAGQVVSISYGFIPEDLSFAATQWVVELLAYTSRIGTKSESLAGQETVSFDTSSVPPRVLEILKPYRRVTFV
jgi:hypothetical protein